MTTDAPTFSDELISTELDRELADLTSGTGGAAAVATSMTVGSYLLPPKLIIIIIITTVVDALKVPHRMMCRLGAGRAAAKTSSNARRPLEP